MPNPEHVIEIVGEGKTDIGRGDDQPGPPTTGVVPILVHRLCDRPESMQVRRRPLPFLRRKSLSEKVQFAKRQAYYNNSAGLVFVLDTEGVHPGQLKELQQGRDSRLPDYPTAVGVAHPCIEAWLLADTSAISKAMGCARLPDVPELPESLPGPCQDRSKNPKIVLSRCAGADHQLSSAEATRIVQKIRDLDTIRDRCPISFVPFADEVVRLIKPIFEVIEDEQTA